jgi:hypothetical protein
VDESAYASGSLIVSFVQKSLDSCLLYDIMPSLRRTAVNGFFMNYLNKKKRKANKEHV